MIKAKESLLERILLLFIYEIVPAIFLNLINHLFALFFLFYFANFCKIKFYEICAYKFLARPVGPLCLSSLLLEDWSLLCQWHPKELKLCMSTRAMTRLSLHNRHMTLLRAPWLVAKQNQHLHSQQNKQVSLLVC